MYKRQIHMNRNHSRRVRAIEKKLNYKPWVRLTEEWAYSLRKFGEITGFLIHEDVVSTVHFSKFTIFREFLLKSMQFLHNSRDSPRFAFQMTLSNNLFSKIRCFIQGTLKPLKNH